MTKKNARKTAARTRQAKVGGKYTDHLKVPSTVDRESLVLATSWEDEITAMPSPEAINKEAQRLLLLNEGWRVVFWENVERPSFGMEAFRCPNGIEESRLYEWLPFGKKLELQIVSLDDPAEFYRLVNAMHSPKPVYRRRGFVSYVNGHARIVCLSDKGLAAIGGGQHFTTGLRTELKIEYVSRNHGSWNYQPVWDTNKKHDLRGSK